MQQKCCALWGEQGCTPFTPTLSNNFILKVPTVSAVLGLEVMGFHCVTVPAQPSHWLLVLSLFSFFFFSCSYVGAHFKCGREVHQSVCKRLAAMSWWLSHSVSFSPTVLFFFWEKICIVFYHNRHHSSVTCSKIKLSWAWPEHNAPPPNL